MSGGGGQGKGWTGGGQGLWVIRGLSITHPPVTTNFAPLLDCVGSSPSCVRQWSLTSQTYHICI